MPPITARQIIERIQQNIGTEWRDETIDTFKTGNPEDEVRGVAVTMVPSFEVLQKAIASGANLIIAHEPAFYGHNDETERLEQENDVVFGLKRELIEKHRLILWRSHDHWHYRKPDGINTGMIEALGWKSYKNPSDECVFTLPEQSLEELARQLKTHLRIRALRVVGDASMRVSKVAFSAGFPGFNVQRHLLQRDDVEVLVMGEAYEWETIAYAADAHDAGLRKALIILGHIPSEQGGMEEFARWLKTLVKDVPIEYIPTSEPFWLP